MHITDIAGTARRRAPVPGGPTAAVLTAEDADQVAVMHLEIPADGGMPEHDHGPSQIVLIPVAGSVEVHHGGQVEVLSRGAVAHIGVGERVSLANPGGEPASLMVVVSPPEFARRLASWPLAGAAESPA